MGIGYVINSFSFILDVYIALTKFVKTVLLKQDLNVRLASFMQFVLLT